MTTGRRYGGPDALAAGLVDATTDEGAVVAEAVRRAGAPAGKHGPTLAAIKRSMYAPALAALRQPSPGFGG